MRGRCKIHEEGREEERKRKLRSHDARGERHKSQRQGEDREIIEIHKEQCDGGSYSRCGGTRSSRQTWSNAPKRTKKKRCFVGKKAGFERHNNAKSHILLACGFAFFAPLW
jgi:hypothetical protein